MHNENSATASVATTSVNTKKLALAAVFAAIAVVGSTFSVPVFGSKCAPVQHLVNVLCAVFLGPAYGVAAAFIASVIRNLMGLGSLLAFPGSMCGAFLSGYLIRSFGSSRQPMSARSSAPASSVASCPTRSQPSSWATRRRPSSPSSFRSW